MQIIDNNTLQKHKSAINELFKTKLQSLSSINQSSRLLPILFELFDVDKESNLNIEHLNKKVKTTDYFITKNEIVIDRFFNYIKNNYDYNKNDFLLIVNLKIKKREYNKYLKEENVKQYETKNDKLEARQEKFIEIFSEYNNTDILGNSTNLLFQDEKYFSNKTKLSENELIMLSEKAKKLLSENEKMKNIFDYSSFSCRENEVNWTKHDLFNSLDIRVCPYCNRQYITNYKEIDGEKEIKIATGDADHFYPQSIFPFLALSIYNLIPSCQICNSRFKLDINPLNRPMLYPYENKFLENAEFTIENEDLNYLIKLENDFDLKINCDDIETKTQNSIEVFGLKKIYQAHKGYVVDIYKKHIWYDELYREQLAGNLPDIFKNEEEVFSLLYDNYEKTDDIYQKPLAKLTVDILKTIKDI